MLSDLHCPWPNHVTAFISSSSNPLLCVCVWVSLRMVTWLTSARVYVRKSARPVCTTDYGMVQWKWTCLLVVRVLLRVVCHCEYMRMRVIVVKFIFLSTQPNTLCPILSPLPNLAPMPSSLNRFQRFSCRCVYFRFSFCFLISRIK